MSKQPPFEIVSVEPYSHYATERLRISVALSPEDMDEVTKVAQAIIEEHAGVHDELMLFFFHSSEAAKAGIELAVARAQYIRNGSDRKQMRTLGRAVEIAISRGLITIEVPEVNG